MKQLRAGEFGDMWERLEGSAVMLQVFSPSMVKDPAAEITPLLQFAFALYLDRPILVVVRENDVLPAHVARVADRIVRVSGDLTDEDQAKIKAALEQLMEGVR